MIRTSAKVRLGATIWSRGVPDGDLIAETQGDDTDESTQRVAVILRPTTCIAACW